MYNILIVNSTEPQCGVHQFGKRVYNILYANRTIYDYPYIQCNSREIFWQNFNIFQPKLVLFNYHPSTMGWVNHSFLNSIPVPKLSLFHEVPITGFDYLVHLDTTYQPKQREFIVPRPLFEYRDWQSKYFPNEIPTFGSFGFGFGNKRFEMIVEKVQEEFDYAEINLHIPFAHFGDADGRSARNIAEICKSKLYKKNVHLNITHHFMDDDELLDFLASNDVNCFFFEHMYGRGISSSIDYALSVKKPIAITNSYMFRHIYKPEIDIEFTSLRTIRDGGFTPLMNAYEINSQRKMIESYEGIFDELI